MKLRDNMFRAVDLFCGAGGFSTALLEAAARAGIKVALIAINHWKIAIDTHMRNHPDVLHICETLDSVDPRKLVPGGFLNLLMASPECTHHSKARGGIPKSDQSRATAWHILRWAEAIHIENLLVENVEEFVDWGPLDEHGRVIEHLKGTLFQSFVQALRNMDYDVEWKILNSANYGDATARRRLFLQARKKGSTMSWPESTHAPAEKAIAECLQPYNTARDIIDFTIPSRSIYGRKKSLVPATLGRLETGLQKFCGFPQDFTLTPDGKLEPFLVLYKKSSTASDIDRPTPTMTTQPHLYLAEPQLKRLDPYLVKYYQGSTAVDLDHPVPTITASYSHLYLAEPCLIHFNRNCDARSLDEPMKTIPAGGGHFGLLEPVVRSNFLVEYYGTGSAKSVEQPLHTITTKARFGLVDTAVNPLTDEWAWLDIRFRMLQVEELARAMSFPSDYHFTGTQQQQIKQVGNAVAVKVAGALCFNVLEQYRDQGFRIAV